MLEFKIPNDPDVLKAMANYLLVQAGEAPVHDVPIRMEFTEPELDKTAAEVAKTATEIFTETPTGETTPPAEEPPSQEETAAPEGVKLADGIPWDPRIHASSKATLATAPHGWKRKRKPADKTPEEWSGYILSVEAELRAAMAAAPPIEDLPGVGTVPAVTEPLPGTGDPTNPLVPVVAQAINTFAELNDAIISNGIDTAKVLEAVNAAGLAAYPLLAARPDLIPTVAAKLFPAV